MALSEPYYIRQKLPKVDRYSQAVYLSIIFMLTIGPMIGFAGALMNTLFATGIVFSFGVPAMITLPFLLLGGVLGLWYAYVNYREQRGKERRIISTHRQLVNKISLLETSFENPNCGDRAALHAFLTTLSLASPEQTQALYEKYKQLSQGNVTYDDFLMIQQALRTARQSPFQTLGYCINIIALKKSQKHEPKPPQSSLLTHIKSFFGRFFSTVTINSARSAQAATLITYSLLSIKLAFIMIAGLLGMTVTWPALLTGFISVFIISLGVGAISAVSTSNIFKKTQEQDRFIQNLRLINRKLESRNQILNELAIVSQYSHLNFKPPKKKSFAGHKIEVVQEQEISLEEVPAEKSFKHWQGLYAGIVFFLTAGQVIGFGTAISSGLFVAGVATAPIGVAIILTTLVGFFVTGILLGLWHAIGIHRDLTKKTTHLLNKNEFLTKKISRLENRFQNQNHHPQLFEFIKKIKATNDIDALYHSYSTLKYPGTNGVKHQAGFEDFTCTDFHIIKTLTTKNNDIAKTLSHWSQFRKVASQYPMITEEDFKSFQVLLEKNKFEDALEKWIAAKPKNELAPNPPNILSILLSSFAVNPVRAAQATGILSFSLLSLGTSIILAGVAIGITVTPPVILGGFIATITISALFGAGCAVVVSRLMKHVYGLKVQTDKLEEDDLNIRYQTQLLRKIEIRAKAFVLNQPDHPQTTASKTAKNEVLLDHSYTFGYHHDKPHQPPLPQSAIPEKRRQTLTAAT